MTEIRVERKERRNVWPWILVAIVAMALVWWLMRNRNANTAATANTSLRAVPAAVVAAYDAATQSPLLRVA